jgi:hypothetical protein
MNLGGGQQRGGHEKPRGVSIESITSRGKAGRVTDHRMQVPAANASWFNWECDESIEGSCVAYFRRRN